MEYSRKERIRNDHVKLMRKIKLSVYGLEDENGIIPELPTINQIDADTRSVCCAIEDIDPVIPEKLLKRIKIVHLLLDGSVLVLDRDGKNLEDVEKLLLENYNPKMMAKALECSSVIEIMLEGHSCESYSLNIEQAKNLLHL